MKIIFNDISLGRFLFLTHPYYLVHFQTLPLCGYMGGRPFTISVASHDDVACKIPAICYAPVLPSLSLSSFCSLSRTHTHSEGLGVLSLCAENSGTPTSSAAAATTTTTTTTTRSKKTHITAFCIVGGKIKGERGRPRHNAACVCTTTVCRS